MKILSLILSKMNIDMDLKKAFSNSLYLFFIQALNYIFPLIALPFLLNILSIESFGIYVYSLAAIQFMMLLVDFGFTITISKKIATFHQNSKDVVDTYWLISIIQLFIFFITFLIYLGLFFSFPFLFVYRWGIIAASFSVFGFVLFPNWLFQGLNRMKTLSIINLTSKLLTYPFFFLLIRNPEDHILAIFIQSSSYVVAGILSIIIIFRDKLFQKIDFKIFSIYNIKMELLGSKAIFLSNSAITIVTTSFTLLLGVFSTAFYVGLFGAIDRIIQALSFGVFVPINQAFFPVLAKMGISNLDKAKKYFKLVFYSMFIIMGIIYFGLIYFEDFIIRNFFDKYGDIKLILRIATISIIPVTLGGVCGQLGLIALGGDTHKKIFSNIYIYTCLISLPLSVIFIYFFNFYGAIISMMFAQIFIFIGMLYFVKKYRLL